MDLLALFIAFVMGVLVQRVYAARVKGWSKLGISWGASSNRLYRILHQFYCEFCPRRLYCERYKEEVE